MLVKSVLVEEPGFNERGEAVIFLKDTGEVEADPCVVCGGESRRHACMADGRSHWHGLVHNVRGNSGSGELWALCDKHYALYREFLQPHLDRLLARVW